MRLLGDNLQPINGLILILTISEARELIEDLTTMVGQPDWRDFPDLIDSDGRRITTIIMTPERLKRELAGGHGMHDDVLKCLNGDWDFSE